MHSRRTLLKNGIAMTALVLTSFSFGEDAAVGGGSGRAPGWRELAAHNQSFTAAELAEAAERVEKLPPPVAARARNLLDRMAAVSLDGPGLRAALALRDKELPSFYVLAPGERPGNEHPHGFAVRRASLILLHGLIASAGAKAQAAKQPEEAAAELIRAARSSQNFQQLERTRLDEELMLALTSKLYFAAEKRAFADKPAAK